MKKFLTITLIGISFVFCCSITHALGDVWIDKVILFDQPAGSSTGGGPPEYALGPNDNRYVAIDIPETLILQFTDNSALDGVGSDIRIYEYGGDNSYADIYGSKDGINWVFLINGYGNLMIDLNPSGLEYINYLKFVGKDDLGTYDGYDLDAVEALNSGEHIDSDLLGDVWIDRVILFDQPAGSSTGGGPPDNALGPNDNAYVSIDIPEILILQFTDNSALDGDGPDIRIYEYGGDNSYADIYGSKDGINWVFLINGYGNLMIDLNPSGLEYINYLKFVGKDDLGTYDGYDLDAVEALNSRSQAKSDIVGKVFCGYQGWFNCEGDGSPLDIYDDSDAWRHWSEGIKPSPDNQTFELYPDISEYPLSSLFATNYSNLGNGRPSKLFSSFSSNIVGQHFNWMKEYGIDGVALQRFGTDIYCDPNWPRCWLKETVDEIALNVKSAAEKFNKPFYVMYDISGMNNLPEDFAQLLKNDWENTVSGDLGLISSAKYAKHKGKNVVAIWGVGFKDRPGTESQFTELISWFKSQGCYVIGGVPSDWRTGDRGDSKLNFENVYQSLDMISPWTVGRYATDQEIDDYRVQYLIPDKAYCDNNGIAYQPVIFPGFSWSNWVPGSPRNQIPRRGGELFWKQAYNIVNSGITSAYIAMFDEYDEATAIAKAAEDFSMIPTDQYFLTLSADGVYISSDFYLRLAGEMTRMIKGLIPPEPDVPIPYSTGPDFIRSSVEEGYDAMPAWVDTVDDHGGGTTNVVGFGGSGYPECGIVSGEQANSGNYAIRFSGRDISNTGAYIYFKVFEVNIPVSQSTKLSYWIFPQQELGRYVAIDLIMSDGSTLRDSGAADYDGVSMHPSAGRGTINAWNPVICDIGRWLNGKTIDRIAVGYNSAPKSGDFRGYIDDILISNEPIAYNKAIPWIPLLLLDD